jgi:hypothetical protein
MAFTYTGALDTNLDILRFEIGDTVSGAGVLPDGTNIPDATLNAVIAAEGSVGLAAARVCEALARHWTRVAASQTVGSRSEANQQMANFRALAQDLRKRYGGDASGFVAAFGRDDGYHQQNEFTEEESDSEYESRTLYIRI